MSLLGGINPPGVKVTWDGQNIHLGVNSELIPQSDDIENDGINVSGILEANKLNNKIMYSHFNEMDDFIKMNIQWFLNAIVDDNNN